MSPNESLAIHLANEVGATSYSTPPMRAVTGRSFTWDQLEKLVELAVAAEREECAKWIETQRNDIPACGFEFASAIRARK